MRLRLLFLFAALLLSGTTRTPAVLDQNGNQQSDIWESMFGAIALNPSLDADGDGFTNLQEAIAGTNPLDPNSHPRFDISISGSSAATNWASIAGKRYQIFSNATLDPATWQLGAIVDGTGANLAMFF